MGKQRDIQTGPAGAGFLFPGGSGDGMKKSSFRFAEGAGKTILFLTDSFT